MSHIWYFLNTNENSGDFNMKLDSYLFEQYINESIKYPILRVYGWTEPTISLGMNQAQNKINYPFKVVKRITGGQAVFHDIKENELTYSVILNTEYGPKKTYDEISKALISFLKSYSLNAQIGYEKQDLKNTFNCFESKTEADIVVNDIKVIGSAQRVKRKSTGNDKKQYVLQHGSIRLDKIRELSGKNADFNGAIVCLKTAFIKEFGIMFEHLSSEFVGI